VSNEKAYVQLLKLTCDSEYRSYNTSVVSL
jgi:hypothetical protein